MSDIFISYASEDRPRAGAISKRLEQEGWSVWWDRKIVPGQTFDKVIEEALDTARCIVVLWSNSAKRSDWVRNEATVGHRRGVLVPAFIETVSLPLEFMRIQTADLSGWEQQAPENEMPQFIDAIKHVLTGQGVTQDPVIPELNEKGVPGGSSTRVKRFKPGGGHGDAVWRSAIRIIGFAIVSCLSILGLFKAIYPQTNLAEAATAIVILSLFCGAGLNYLWLFWRSRKTASKDI